MPYVTKTASNGQKLKILIDTGTSKNYIKDLSFLKGVESIANPFFVKSINGKNLINKSCKISLLNHVSTFYLLPQLSSFDGIIGYDFLKGINAKIDIGKNVLTHHKGQELLQLANQTSVNTMSAKTSISNSLSTKNFQVPEKIQERFNHLISKLNDAFASPNRALPYNTSIKATIRTTNEDPIYTRSYPYPISATEFINNEIQSLLRDGIIQKSCSPYNSPIHVVKKKGMDKEGKPNLRMVIDFRKLNEKTIPDRYPIPETSVILANLGKAAFYTTLDLKSGFHQILMDGNDRQKTAFSVNNGKYEFCRLPFGLRNAPSIFQRTIDDILREWIGKCCYVYIDDIIIYSPDIECHLRDIETIITNLKNSGMRISSEKSKFFKAEVEFLGFTVSRLGIKTCQNKIKDILNYQTPETLRALRSFLGLSGYYRRFIQDYAAIAKPLSKYLRGDNGQIGTSSSRKIKINLDPEALLAFKKLKNILASDDVLLQHPDYSKPFELTTDASSSALGAVLSQNGRPITMISRTLSQTEENYATNERELLAIVWSLQSLRHYLYGVKDIKIFTDHQPLIFAISDKNPNTKMKRWRAFIEEFSPQFFYKPGNENRVADALSRQFINTLSLDNGSTSISASSTTVTANSSPGTVHSELSSTEVIKTTKYPVNQFKNQLIITKSSVPTKSTTTIFPNFTRHLVSYDSIETLIKSMKDTIKTNATNAIYCDLTTLAEIQNKVVKSFPGIKFIRSPVLVIDLTDKNDQLEVATNEHNRAHRNLKENAKQISSQYFFPKMSEILKPIVSNCKICLENKYQRKPPKPEIGATPIPNYPGEILHIDIFYTSKQHFITCIDKFSKFAIVHPINSRSTIDVKPSILQILGVFQNTKLIVSDNEKAFESNALKNLLRDQFGIEQFFVPTLHSESNGQVERFHSTLLELSRCIQRQQLIQDPIDLIILSTNKYNQSIHSVTKLKPIDALHTDSPEKLKFIKDCLIKEQQKTLERFNANAINRTYRPGEKVFVRRNKRLGNKLDKIFVEKAVQQDLGTTVLIDGKRIHKSNLR